MLSAFVNKTTEVYKFLFLNEMMKLVVRILGSFYLPFIVCPKNVWRINKLSAIYAFMKNISTKLIFMSVNVEGSGN